jgi:hypothetical protein
MMMPSRPTFHLYSIGRSEAVGLVQDQNHFIWSYSNTWNVDRFSMPFMKYVRNVVFKEAMIDYFIGIKILGCVWPINLRKSTVLRRNKTRLIIVTKKTCKLCAKLWTITKSVTTVIKRYDHLSKSSRFRYANVPQCYLTRTFRTLLKFKNFSAC